MDVILLCCMYTILLTEYLEKNYLLKSNITVVVMFEFNNSCVDNFLLVTLIVSNILGRSGPCSKINLFNCTII